MYTTVPMISAVPMWKRIGALLAQGVPVDTAVALGVSVGKVKTDIHRGREALRALLSDHAPR